MLDARTIEGFSKSLLSRNFDNAVETPDCHREWWDLVTRPNKFVAIAAPRGHAKSTAITLAYVLAKTCFRESSYIVIVSDTEAQSILFLSDLKKELAENEDLQKLFAVDDIATWPKQAETDVIVRFKDGHEARLVAKGAGQAMRGMKWGGKRPDLIVCDDMENDELVANKDRRDKLKRWVKSTLLPIRSSTGIIRVVGTIIHADSWLAELMPKEHAKTTVVTPLKIYSSVPSGWLSVLYRAHPGMNDFSHVLWPAKLPREELQALRNMYVADGHGDVYAAEYLNTPIDEENALFRKSDFKELTEKDKEKRVNFYIGADLAVTEKTRSDYTVFVVGGVTEDNDLQIRHVVRERMDSREIVETIIELQRSYDPFLFCFEKGTIVNSIMPILRQRMSETGVFCNIELTHSNTDKVQRAQSIRARARAGKVRVDKEAEWWGAFEDEFLKFPKAVHDDQVDGTSQLGLAINKFVEAATQEEVDEDEYLEAFEASQMTIEGRNQITGY